MSLALTITDRNKIADVKTMYFFFFLGNYIVKLLVGEEIRVLS